jgi:ADP-ribose pyrophosphatase YjhB (NUDIX family)
MITCHFENGDKAGLRHVVVGVIIIKDKKVLLSKRGTYNGKPILESGKWSLIGGFVDRDENLIGTAKREVMEETGWTIDDVRLFNIIDNPQRPRDNERQNVSIIFLANAVHQTPIITEEVTDLKWFDLDHLPLEKKIAFDHNDSLVLYKKYLKKKFPLPIFG